MTEAIILAGGKGTRLQSVVKHVPKPMASVAKKPFLTYLLEQLYQAGFEKIFLSVGYKYDVIQSYFGNRYRGMKLIYIVESEPLGTGGGIRLAMNSCNSENVLVLNGDTYMNLQLSELAQFHLTQSYDSTLAVRRVLNANRYGKVVLDESRIIGFQEKSNDSEEGYINAGMYIFRRSSFLKNTQEGAFSLETEFFQKRANELSFGAFVSKEYFIDIGVPEDYHKANEYFKGF